MIRAMFCTTYRARTRPASTEPSKTSSVGALCMRRRNRVAWRNQPITNTRGAVITIDTIGLRLMLLNSQKVTNAPIMMNSPWATLSTRPTPYCRLSPTETRAKMPPSSSPVMMMSLTAAIHDPFVLLLRDPALRREIAPGGAPLGRAPGGLLSSARDQVGDCTCSLLRPPAPAKAAWDRSGGCALGTRVDDLRDTVLPLADLPGVAGDVQDLVGHERVVAHERLEVRRAHDLGDLRPDPEWRPSRWPARRSPAQPCRSASPRSRRSPGRRQRQRACRSRP